jgi:hypothetical protein
METAMPVMATLYGLGRPFWVVAMILGFILWWPLGLAALAFLYWSRKMGFCDFSRDDRWQRKAERWQMKMDRMREKFDRHTAWGAAGAAMRPSGNSAFDEYKVETLKRLEEEQNEFQSFLERLRHAKDKAEFDQFMTERRNRPTPPAPTTEA